MPAPSHVAEFNIGGGGHDGYTASGYTLLQVKRYERAKPPDAARCGGGNYNGFLSGLRPSSTKANSPLIQEMGGMQKLIVKLRDYSETNSMPLIWNKVGTNIDALVEAGALSPADASYIRLHKLEFRGFDPARIAGDVTVFELVFTNSSNPTRRIIGHSDGSVAVRSREGPQ